MTGHPKLANLSLRKKLILVFMTILLLLAAINCVQIYLFLGYVRQYNAMMETITLTNSINGILKQKLDEEIRDIAYGKVLFENGTQYDLLNNMVKNLDALEKDDKKRQFTKEISEVRQTVTTTNEYIDKLGEQIQGNVAADSRNITYEYITILTDLIDEKVQALLQKTLVAKSQSKNLISENLKRDITIYICSFIALIVISLLFAIFISGSFVKPIRKLGQQTNEIAKGNLTIGAIENPAQNEIGELCRSYNRMFQNLKDIIINVRNTNDLVVLTSKDIHQSILENQQAGEEVAVATQTISINLQNQDLVIQQSVSTFEHLLLKFNEALEKLNKISHHSNETTLIIAELNRELSNFTSHHEKINRTSQKVDGAADDIQKLSKEMHGYISLSKLAARELRILALTLITEIPKELANEKVESALSRIKEVSDEMEKSSHDSDSRRNGILRLTASIRKQNAGILKESQLSRRRADEVITNNLLPLQSIHHRQQYKMDSINQDMHEAFDQMLTVQQIVSNIEQNSQIISSEVARIAAMGEEQLTTFEEVSDASYKLVNRIQEMKNSIRQFTL